MRSTRRSPVARLGEVGPLRCQLEEVRLRNKSWTTRELAAATQAQQLPITFQRLSGIQGGQIIPNLAELDCLTAVLGCSIEDLYPNEDVRRVVLHQLEAIPA